LLVANVSFLLGTLPDKTEIILIFGTHPGRFSLLAGGTADSLAELGEIVAWLVSAVRCSPDENTRAYCTPHVKRSDRDVFSYNFDIEIDTSLGDETQGIEGRCWHGMFRNPVIVRGFPIPRRPRANTGLEIPLHMAARLTDARRVHDFRGRLCLKGFSAMLAVVEVVGDMVLWHLHHNATGGRVSYLDAHKSSYTGTIDTNVLRVSRHVIGWCSHAEYLAGTYLSPLHQQN
jgi:hypothetical protein